MNKKFIELREEYKEIIYKSYSIQYLDDLVITFRFEIPGLSVFEPSITISKNSITNNNIDDNLVSNIAFRIGLIELISYYKCVCPKKVVIEAGYIDKDEEKWFKKLFFNGLGEFFFVNGIDISEDELFDFDVRGSLIEVNDINYIGKGNLVPVGGGKDSSVTLELLKNYDNKCFVINPKDTHLKCATDEVYSVKRVIDKNLLELNKQGFLNGHTPFSAIVAFVSYLVAYLSNRKYIVLSNEGSANESTVIGTNINHQYSKTYEFERDFYLYTKKYFKIDINYFSLLRPVREVQIAYLFSKFKEYHTLFRSCNVGSKETPWIWCGKCPKCLFVYIIMYAFLTKEEVINIFGKDLLDDKELEKSFLELIGEAETKPFECIGTIEEVKWSMNRIVEKDDSYLSNLYKDKYYENIDIDLKSIVYENNVPEEYLDILKEAISK